MPELNIRQVINGYILTWRDKNELDDYETMVDMQEVIEEDEDERNGMKKLLEFVADHFGIGYDKWGKDNLKISFNQWGHKVE